MRKQTMSLDEWMTKNGVSAYALGMRLGTNVAHILRIRKGVNEPGLELAAKLFVVTGGRVTSADLLRDRSAVDALATKIEEAA